jgi:hypothetical protein
MNAAGGLESHVRYYPYGMTWTQSAAPVTDRLFTGHQQMGAKSGTYYAGARNYAADLGGFISGGCDTSSALAGGAADLAGDAAALTTDVANFTTNFWTLECAGFLIDAAAFGLNFIPGGIVVKATAQGTVGAVLFATSLGISGSQGDVLGIALGAGGEVLAPLGSLSKAFYIVSGASVVLTCSPKTVPL